MTTSYLGPLGINASDAAAPQAGQPEPNQNLPLAYLKPTDRPSFRRLGLKNLFLLTKPCAVTEESGVSPTPWLKSKCLPSSCKPTKFLLHNAAAPSRWVYPKKSPLLSSLLRPILKFCRQKCSRCWTAKEEKRSLNAYLAGFHPTQTVNFPAQASHAYKLTRRQSREPDYISESKEM